MNVGDMPEATDAPRHTMAADDVGSIARRMAEIAADAENARSMAKQDSPPAAAVVQYHAGGVCLAFPRDE